MFTRNIDSIEILGLNIFIALNYLIESFQLIQV